jgi:hypothetical protein
MRGPLLRCDAQILAAVLAAPGRFVILAAYR